ncbi:DUF4012 domain-containing protein [Nocardioides campestrisoli]|uniref:DUF4012 domain-containing protein n=1 Tax=Nocardioides campestrisoli TaxID=2736757 RepID=UPI0015E74972|nr:DUF4012 domain-containing protein [Nocardioides campestrisoli]
MTLRRALGLLLAVIMGAGGYAAWVGWQVKGDLESAETHGRALEAALRTDDRVAAEEASDRLQRASASARKRTDGPLWRALSHLPVVGDDAEGVRVLSRSMETFSAQAVPPLLETSSLLQGVSRGQGVHLPTVRALSEPVTAAASALHAATRDVAGVDSAGFVEPLRDPFEEYVDLVAAADRGFGAATTAVELLPDMLGGSGPRDYLIVFQNNAEVRASGGLPGAWAHVRTEGGRITLVEQGSTADFPERQRPVLSLFPVEREIYGTQLGTYWHDANFTPHFPRSAELWTAHFEESRPVDLDGVLSLDTVALSYLLKGTGPVSAAGITIDSENAVDQLLHQTYRDLADPAAQDARFQAMALAIFDAVTGEVDSPMDLAAGFGRAGREGRFLVHSFRPEDRERLRGTTVAGELVSESSERPTVDVTFNDATGSKMSYYLRYDVRVRAEACRGGDQRLAGSMRLGSTIAHGEVDDLPDYISGGGFYGTEPGSQLVVARIHGPVDGEVTDVRFDGEPIEVETVELDGRPVATLVAQLSPTQNVDVTWRMTTGEGQTGDGRVGVTPSIVSGDADSTFASAC